MNQTAGRIAGGLILLITLWIGVYWWWPSEPRISFAQDDDTIRGVKPSDPPPAPPVVAPVRTQAQPTLPAAQPRTEATGPAQPFGPPPPRIVPPPPESSSQMVVPPEFTKHTVQKGETFETIARKYFGAKARGSIIANANPMMDPSRLTPGRTVLVPRDPKNIQGAPAPQRPVAAADATVEEYTVQPGDSLSAIASEVYGDPRLARRIFEANRDQLTSENAIKVGQKLRIPRSAEGG